jgi:hypothetical protein
MMVEVEKLLNNIGCYEPFLLEARIFRQALPTRAPVERSHAVATGS